MTSKEQIFGLNRKGCDVDWNWKFLGLVPAWLVFVIAGAILLFVFLGALIRGIRRFRRVFSGVILITLLAALIIFVGPPTAKWLSEKGSAIVNQLSVVFLIFFGILLIWHLVMWRSVFVKVPYGYHGILTILGRFTDTTLGQGLHLIPLPGIFGLIQQNTMNQRIQVDVTDIWTENKDDTKFLERLKESGLATGRARIKARLAIEYQVVDLAKFLTVKDFSELLKSLCQDTLRDATIGKSVNETLSRNGQTEIRNSARKNVIGGAVNWGVNVLNVYLEELDFADASIKDAAQRLFQEIQEQTAEITEAQTIVLQAEQTLESQGITEQSPDYQERLREEVDKVRRQRVSETGAKTGKAIIIPFPIDLFDRDRDRRRP